MTDAEYRHALELLASAHDLLQRRNAAADADLRRELRRLSMELDLLRIQVSQVAPGSRRN